MTSPAPALAQRERRGDDRIIAAVSAEVAAIASRLGMPTTDMRSALRASYLSHPTPDPA